MNKGTKKESSSSDDDWIKCQSKSRPGRYYMFNKGTGETKWCSTGGDQTDGDTKSNQLSTPKDIRSKEPPPQWSMGQQKSVRTPAQDRLKRLQRNLKKDLKVLAETKNTNSNQEKHARNDTKLIAARDIKIKEEPETENKHSSVIKSSPRRKLKPAMDTEDDDSDAKSFSSPKVRRTSSNKSTKKTSPKKSSSPRISKDSPTKEKLKSEVIESSIEGVPQKDSTNSFSFGVGIVDKIKTLCKNTLKNSKNCIKKTTFKIPKNKVNQIQNNSSSIKAAYKDIQNSIQRNGKESETSANTPTKSSEDQFVLLNIPKSIAMTTPPPLHNTPKNLVIPEYLTGSANLRLERLRQSLLLQPSSSTTSSFLSNEASTSQAALNISSHKSDNDESISDDFEAMDWQPIDDEDKISLDEKEAINISSSESSITSSNNTRHTPSCSSIKADSTVSEYYDTVNENLLRFSAEQHHSSRNERNKWSNDFYYFVIDTNVLLQNLTFIDDLSKMKLCETKGTILYIPYTVLQELDKLKIRSGSESAKTLTVRAIKYLNTKFEEHNQHIRAQSASDERRHLINVTSPDDSILNCCLQVKQHVDNVILLTEDVNLRNKAICNNLLVSTKSDLISKHAASSSSTWHTVEDSI